MNLAILRARAKIVSAVRRFFDEQGFVEVETAVRIPAPAPEEHIDCPPVVDGGYLRASPELQMKKLLAAGMDKIYQIGPCFREGERGSRHNPEFTMIEWYRKNATYLDIANDLERLLGCVARFANDSSRSSKSSDSSDSSMASNSSCSSDSSMASPARRLSVRDAYLRFVGWDPWQGPWDQDRFDFDMATKIEPAIKELGGGVFLMDYPPQAASLAKVTEEEEREPGAARRAYAERWEFYWDGLELANCFTELCDREEQLKRFEAAKASRKLLNEADYPIDYEFIDSLPQMGHAAGVALGIDRLVMVLTNSKEISAVRANI